MLTPADKRAAFRKLHESGCFIIPNPVDVHVGKRIRMRRLLLGMNQETLANALGLTFQQVQKYEGGANRVSASRLAATAEILKVPISFFFGDLQTDDGQAQRTKRGQGRRLFAREFFLLCGRHSGKSNGQRTQRAPR